MATMGPCRVERSTPRCRRASLGEARARVAENRTAALAAPMRVRFNNGGAFLQDIRRDVDAYLAEHRTSVRGMILLRCKAPVAIAMTFTCWAVLLFAGTGRLVDAIAAVGLALGLVLTGFCVQHDANHGTYFTDRRANHLLGWTSDVVLGFSSYIWRVKHNVAHHTYTNVDEFDDDVSKQPLVRLLPSQRPALHYRLQHVYIWLLYSLMTLHWATTRDWEMLRRARVGRSPVRPPRGWDLVGFVAGKVLFYGWTLVIPMLIFPPWQVLLFALALSMVASLVVATVFQLAHCVEEASFFAPEALQGERRIWAVHEVESTVNFCPDSRLLTWVLGGLNYQIEHHLFPKIPHTHYAAISKLVQRRAAEHGVRYTTQPTLRHALRSHYRHVRLMGRAGRPVEIEMG
jgi:linoleoyl-CoA desaturase